MIKVEIEKSDTSECFFCELKYDHIIECKDGRFCNCIHFDIVKFLSKYLLKNKIEEYIDFLESGDGSND